MVKPNIAIVSSYNDMLSAHKPFETYPAQLKQAVLEAGGIAQFAGGVPAMCDGITQGRDGMQLSLFSRDVIAMATAIALSHDMFDAALLLGCLRQDRARNADRRTGIRPSARSIFVPAGPMTSGLPNAEKSRIRQLYAEGKVDRDALLDAEAASYHGRGTCTFYGTANSNQLLMEAMGLHLPGSSLVNPDTPLRDALTARGRSAGHRADRARASSTRRSARSSTNAPIVNGCVALLATGGSTNHTMHLVAIARAAGITLSWNDIADLSAVVPLLARVYPNGKADVNHFHAAGGMAFVINSLLDAGLMHEDVRTVAGDGLRRYTTEPQAGQRGPAVGRRRAGKPGHHGGAQRRRPVRARRRPEDADRQSRHQRDQDLRRQPRAPGGHRARAWCSTARRSSWPPSNPVRWTRDFVAVVRYQGPQGLGMPELHKLTPALGVLQDRGHQVALVTDGRMSGASGKVPAAIHLTPEAAAGGPLARVRRRRHHHRRRRHRHAVRRTSRRRRVRRPQPTGRPPSADEWVGTGRELFASMRSAVGPADEGATVFRSAS